MNEFKQEFSQLLMRYVSNNIVTKKNNRTEVLMPLTNQQVLDAIHETLRVTLNINLQNVESAAMKTPANEFVIATPHAPDVLRIDCNRSNVLKAGVNNKDSGCLKLSNTNLSNPTNQPFIENPENTKEETELRNRFLQKQNSIKDIVSAAQESLDKKLKKEASHIDISRNNKMYSMVDDAYAQVLNAMHKLEDLKELLQPETRPIRRLSSIMSLAIPKYQQQQHQSQHAMSMTSHRVKALRRSIHQMNEEVPVTPTSSHAASRVSLLGTQIQPPKPLATRKSFGGILAKAPSHKVSMLPSLGQSRSYSVSTLSDLNKTMVLKSPTKLILGTKNPKYAHVQSTIPKPVHVTVKRRIQ